MDVRGAEREANSLTFTSSLSSQSSSKDFKTSRKVILLNSNHHVFLCRIPFLLNHVFLRHVSTSSLCGFQSTEAGSWQGCYLPPLCLQPASSAGDLDAETVAAVAVTRTQGHCCSPGSTTNAAPAALDIFSVSRAGARQGKGTESGAVSALRVLVWCAPPPWRQ